MGNAAFRRGQGVYQDGQSSYSLNAQAARKRGRLPLSQAIPVVRHATKCTEREARTALLKTHDGEWHHVSKYGNRVAYYDPGAAIDAILQIPLFVSCCRAHEAISQRATSAHTSRCKTDPPAPAISPTHSSE